MSSEKQVSRASGRRAAIRAFVSIGILVVVIIGLILVNPSDLFLWVKAAHVVAVIAWLAGMLYLPRLFVYHCDAEKGSVQSETFKVMERRLLTVIINPAMILTWALGVWLVYALYPISGYWIWVKIAAVLVISAVHGSYAKAVRLFAEDRNDKSPRYWRMMNEVPTLMMIVAIVMVIVKPF